MAAKTIQKQEDKKWDLLILGARDVLRAYGLEVAIDRKAHNVGNREIDAVLRIRKGTHERLFLAEVKPVIHTATIATAIQRRARNDGTLLITQFVPAPVAEQLRHHRIPFVDLAGNAWLQTPEFLVWVTGRKPATVVRAHPAPRAFQPGGLQLIFALLQS
jgi:hypothetical protein